MKEMGGGQEVSIENLYAKFQTMEKEFAETKLELLETKVKTELLMEVTFPYGIQYVIWLHR
jgi:hypothetical protein